MQKAFEAARLIQPMVRASRIPRSPEKPSYDADAAEAFAKSKADNYNKSHGDLTGYDCPECLNRGYFARIEKGMGGMIYERFSTCKCMAVRRAHEYLAASGLAALLDVMTFDAYKVSQPFQKPLKEACRAYTAELKGGGKPWLFIGGESGAGKTHLCTAVCGEAMKAGIAVRYMVWPEEMKPIRANINDAEEYAKRMNHFKNAPLLYIDDLFKPVKNKATGALEPPTPAEVQIAFELLNYRVIHDFPVILSCEWYLSELVDIDAATGGRIKQKCGKYTLSIGRDRAKNYRLNGGLNE